MISSEERTEERTCIEAMGDLRDDRFQTVLLPFLGQQRSLGRPVRIETSIQQLQVNGAAEKSSLNF